MSPHAPNIAELGFQVGDHVCAFYLFDREAVMYVLQTHPKIFVNGMIITNPHYIPRQQFFGSP